MATLAGMATRCYLAVIRTSEIKSYFPIVAMRPCFLVPIRLLTARTSTLRRHGFECSTCAQRCSNKPVLAPSAQNARPICATPLTLQHPPRRCCKLEPSSPRSLRLRWPSPPLEFPPSITINCARETKMRVYVLGTLPCRKGHWDHMSAPRAHVSLSFSQK